MKNLGKREINEKATYTIHSPALLKADNVYPVAFILRMQKYMLAFIFTNAVQFAKFVKLKDS